MLIPPTAELIILMACIALFPLGGAYLLYSKLPSETVVSGPFKGLQLRLTGAFAGYFAFALLLISFITGYRTLQAEYEPVIVKGRVEPVPGPSAPGDDRIEFTIAPPVVDIEDDGQFSVLVPAPRSVAAQRTKIHISRPGYRTFTLPLVPDPVLDAPLPRRTGFLGRTITIEGTIPLIPEDARPYEPDVGPLAAADSNPPAQPQR